MLTRLANLPRSGWYWIALLVFGLAMEATALIYQYILEYGPCVLCIHVRIWVLGLVLVSLLALALRRYTPGRLAVQVMTVGILAGLTERAWLLLAVERGTVEGECSFDLGLPAWLALDQWFPLLFQVHEACGITPPLPFGFTMAEVLLPVAAVLLAFNALLLLVALLKRRGSAGREG
jgi:disulfide bond formation protein DsbB